MIGIIILEHYINDAIDRNLTTDYNADEREMILRKLSLDDKLTWFTAILTHKTVDKATQLWKGYKELSKIRNESIVHYKPLKELKKSDLTSRDVAEIVSALIKYIDKCYRLTPTNIQMVQKRLLRKDMEKFGINNS